MKPRSTHRRILYFFLFTFIFFLEANATIHYVSKTGSSTPPYTSWATASDSIQKCIDYSVAGDTIYVGNGVYKEKIIIDNKFLALIGSGWDSCIVDSRELSTPTDYYSIYINGGCNLIGFCIKVADNQVGAGIIADNFNSNAIIQSNKIVGADIGIWIFNSNLTFSHNLIFDVRTGIRLEAFNENYYPVIDSNIIVTAVTGEVTNGIRGSFGTSATIRNNLIIGQAGGGGLHLILNPKEIRNNSFEKKQNSGLYGYYFSLGEGIIENNFITGSSSESAFCIFRGKNKVINNNIINSKMGYTQNADSVAFSYNNVWEIENPFTNFNPDSTNLIIDPMVFSEDSSDFHLQMFSPLIDAGDPNILDRDGSRSDIGLFGGPYGEKYTYRDLAPKPPANVTAVYVNKTVNLKWNKNTEADFSHYRIYRDTVPNFIYDTTKIVGVTSDTFFVDNLPVNLTSKNYYYLITSLDNMNHQSAPSEELLVVLTGMNEVPPKVVEEYKLLNNYPNPFNASTKIPYRLKEPGYVKLYIYDMKGELVKVLVNEWQNKGYYEVEFSPNENERKRGETGIEYWTGYNDDIASGRYIYQIIVIGEGNIPVFGSMGKMILLK